MFAKKKTATEDIKVFKICKRPCLSAAMPSLNDATAEANPKRFVYPYYFTYNDDKKEYNTYVLGRTYRQRKELKAPRNTSSMGITLVINEGFHSFSREKLEVVRHQNSRNLYAYRIRMDGTKRQLDSYMVSPIVVSCTIPKGSTYYENEMGEIVSDAIRIDEFIPDEQIKRE